jgi:polyphosphate kinase
MNAKKEIDLKKPKYYFNREISLIEFNSRVLKEAEDLNHPLFERLKFIAILSSNLDEFFMIRIAGLKRQIAAGFEDCALDGMTAREQLIEAEKRLRPLYKRQEQILNTEILPALKKEGIYIHHRNELSYEEIEYVREYFIDNVLPVLTPLTLDPAHPFPRIINRSLNIAFMLNNPDKPEDSSRIAFVQIPPSLPRFVKINREDGYHFVLIEQIIKLNSEILFPGLTIEARNTFRVTRDADIEIADDEAEDLMSEIAEQIKHRKWGTAPVKLEVGPRMPKFLLEFLMESLELDTPDIYIHDRPLNLPDLMFLTKLDYRHLKDAPFLNRPLPEFVLEENSVFDAIKKKDLIVHHPYDSFNNNVLRFINEAVDDVNVLAIKITLYRVGMNSPVVEALKRAAAKGKEVTAFVELKARFDEENNILWAKELENVGVHVVYGVLGLKTHCKITMIVRKENNKLKTYLHLSTGNYNQVTSRLYTDIGLFTAADDFAQDAMNLFNYLTGYSNYKEWKKLIVAPNFLRKKIIELINREAEKHTEDNPGLIFVKMNALAHEEVMQALYRASQKGVKIKLLIRGVCCLRPGVEGVSENIEVRSIIGRFLEHSRIVYFKNGGDEEYYLTSADWMTRNLHKRVELMYPADDPGIKKYLKNLLENNWKDNKKSWVLDSAGQYSRLKIEDNTKKFGVQEYLLEDTQKQVNKIRKNMLPNFKNNN